MSNGWPLVPMEDIFEIARGGSPRPIDSFLTDDPDGVNWVMISDATESGKYINSTKKRIREEGVKRSRVVQPGDFLLTNSMSFGRPYIMNTSGCIHDGWLVLSPRHQNVSPDFFYHLLGSDFVYAEFVRRAAGATVKNLNIDLVKRVQVPLPPLGEQRRIADVLDGAESLRAKRRASLAQLDTLTQSIFLDLFGDPTANPFDFPMVPLESLMVRPFQNGAYFPKESYCADGGVEMVHMSDAFKGIVKRGTLKRVACSQKDIDTYGLSEADLLVARRSLNYEGSVQPCCVAGSNVPLIFESSLIRLTPCTEKLTVLYLYHYLSNPRVREKFIFPYVTQATISGINQSNLARISVLLPPLPTQHEFARCIAASEKLRATYLASLDELDALFAALQHRAFRGELFGASATNTT